MLLKILNTMCLKLILAVIFIIVFCENVFKTTSDIFPDPSVYKKCSPYFCDNKRFACKSIQCEKDQIKSIKPDQCICCPTCFNKLYEGAECGNDKDTICDTNLKCVNNKCEKSN